jgi:NADH:ubiquinone oxidoreductase subunit F (NADH-binding)
VEEEMSIPLKELIERHAGGVRGKEVLVLVTVLGPRHSVRLSTAPHGPVVFDAF